jgi:hypothetical protein
MELSISVPVLASTSLVRLPWRPRSIRISEILVDLDARVPHQLDRVGHHNAVGFVRQPDEVEQIVTRLEC